MAFAFSGPRQGQGSGRPALRSSRSVGAGEYDCNPRWRPHSYILRVFHGCFMPLDPVASYFCTSSSTYIIQKHQLYIHPNRSILHGLR